MAKRRKVQPPQGLAALHVEIALCKEQQRQLIGSYYVLLGDHLPVGPEIINNMYDNLVKLGNEYLKYVMLQKEYALLLKQQ